MSRRRSLLVAFVGLLFILAAIVLYALHPTTQGVLLAMFLAAAGLVAVLLPLRVFSGDLPGEGKGDATSSVPEASRLPPLTAFLTAVLGMAILLNAALAVTWCVVLTLDLEAELPLPLVFVMHANPAVGALTNLLLAIPGVVLVWLASRMRPRRTRRVDTQSA
jgi:hypothetical protein